MADAHATAGKYYVPHESRWPIIGSAAFFTLLLGVVGRKVAALPGYPYSAAMRAYGADGKRWTRERLDAFIAHPQKVVAHTAMGFFGMPDPAERKALIAWLAEQRSKLKAADTALDKAFAELLPPS